MYELYDPVLILPPASAPVTVEQAKAQLRIEPDDTAEDSLIGALIDAAVAHLSGWNGVLHGRCLVTQTWREDFHCFDRTLRLRLFPIASIASVVYDDADDDEQAITNTDYELLTKTLGSYVSFTDAYSFPSIQGEGPSVRVTYVVGDAVDDVPAPLKHAILMLVTHWFENRGVVASASGGATQLPLAVNALIAPYQRILL